MIAPTTVNQSTVSVKDFLENIHDKSQLHEALLRSGFYLPSIKSSIITQDFLIGVSQGKIWCPRYSDIRLLPCPRPPTKQELIAKLDVALKACGLNLLIKGNHLPNKSWTLIVLGTIKPSDEVFSKNYLPPSTHSTPIKSDMSISFPKSILSGLPVLPSKTKRVRLKLVKEGKELERLENQKNRLAAQDIRIRALEDKMHVKITGAMGMITNQESKFKNPFQNVVAPIATDSKMRNANEDEKD